MRAILIMGTLAITIPAVVASTRTEAMTIGSPMGLTAAIDKANSIQDADYYGYYGPYGYYPPYAYYRYVCRAWWKGCGWEPGHYWNYWPNRYYSRPYGYR